MSALFGSKRAEQMRAEAVCLRPHLRVAYIIKKLQDALGSKGLKYSLEFKFLSRNGRRTLHALVYASKDVKGFRIMRDIMAKESSMSPGGVPSYEYSPDSHHRNPELPLLDPILQFANGLARRYAGKAMTFEKMLNLEEPTLYLDRNYRDAVRLLENRGDLVTDPPAEKRMRGGKLTCGPSVKISFLDNSLQRAV